MTMSEVIKRDQMSKFPIWFSVIGLLVWIGTAALEGRLIWEQTILTWEQGPQMIGFSLLHGDYAFLILMPFILLVWLIAALGVTIVALIRKKRISLMNWISLCLAGLIFLVSFIPQGFWLRLSIDRVSRGPYAVDFLANAAATGDLTTVEELITRGVLVNASDPEDGTTALHAAAVGGQLNVVKYLIERGASINAIDSSGDTPLDDALSVSNDEVAKFLSDQGAVRNQGN